MKKQIVAVAVAVSVFAPAAFASLTYTPATPGFYVGAHRLSTAQVQPFVNKNGSAGIHFVPPSGPVVVRATCGNNWYQYTYYPNPKNKRQEWLDVNGQGMAEKVISSCK